MTKLSQDEKDIYTVLMKLETALQLGISAVRPSVARMNIEPEHPIAAAVIACLKARTQIVNAMTYATGQAVAPQQATMH